MHNSTHAHDPHGAPGHEAHGAGIAQYMYVFLALCVLTTASFLTYTDWWRTHFSPEVGRSFMMAVSCTKALLVILFFMHLKYEADWKYVLTVPASIMSILLILALVPDVGLRLYNYSEERRQHAAEPQQRRDRGAHAETGGHGADAGHATEGAAAKH